MTKATAAELLDLVIDRAPKLRAAGVTHVELEHLALDLAPIAPEPAGEDGDEPVHRGAAYDPQTYGIMDPDAKIPGRTRKER